VPSFILSGAPNFRHSRTKMGTKAACDRADRL